MHADDAALDPQDLLAHAEWVRALARRLLRDEHGAEDVTQSTFAAAIEQPPQHGVPLAPWLARVARNTALQVLRSRGRRRRHETLALAAREAGAAHEAPEQAAMRGEAFRTLVDAVLALDPPYRDVILAVYFDGLSTADAAARFGVPVETARTRKKRALAQLRERLGENGERRPMLLLVAGAGGGDRVAPPAAAAASGVLVTKKALLAAVGAAGLAALLAAWPDPPAAPEDDPAPEVADTPRTRNRGRTGATAAPAAPDPEPASRAVAVRVLDGATGLPVAGAYVERVEDALEARPTGSGGQTEVELPDGGSATVRVSAPGYRGAPGVRLGSASGTTVVTLWPTRMSETNRDVCGVVTDAHGRPLPQVRVRSASAKHLLTAVTNAAGRFRLETPWQAYGVVITAEHPEYGHGAAVAARDWLASGWLRVPDIDIRLGVVHEVRVRVRDAAGGSVPGPFLLTANFDRGLQDHGPELRRSVRDGGSVSLPSGVWVLELRSADDDTLVAAPRRVTVDVAGVHAGVWPWERLPHRLGDDTDPLDALTFEFGASRLDLLVTDAKGPVAEARVVLQDATVADAHGLQYREMPDSRALRPSGISASIKTPRRAPRHEQRTFVTDADGRVAAAGWIPVPTLVSVERDDVVTAYHVVETLPDRELHLEVQRGARIDVALPAHLRACVLERLDAEQALERFTPERLGTVVPPGRYRLRRRRHPGHPTDAVQLVPAFDLRAGDVRTFDLEGLSPRVGDVLLFRGLPRRVRVFARSVWSEDAARPWRPLEDDEVRFHMTSTLGPRRYDLAWDDAVGSRNHQVQFDGNEAPDERVTQHHDVSYDGGALELTVSGLEPGTSLVLSGMELDAPHVHRHMARIPAEAARHGTVVLDHLPAGEYSVYVRGLARGTADVKKVQVERGASLARRIRVENLQLEVVLHGYDASTAGWVFLPVRLQPVGDAPDAKTVYASAWEAPHATFARVPDGRYRLQVVGSGKLRREGTVSYAGVRVLHEEEVTVGPAARRFDVALGR